MSYLGSENYASCEYMYICSIIW